MSAPFPPNRYCPGSAPPGRSSCSAATPCVVQHASRVPPALMAEARARRDDLAAELLAEADDEAGYICAERAAIMAEAEDGDPAAAVPHDMPVSWQTRT